MKSAWPPITAVTAGPSPSNGTDTVLSFVTAPSISATVCGRPPGPVIAILILPGRFLASSTSSVIVFHDASALTTTTPTLRAKIATGKNLS